MRAVLVVLLVLVIGGISLGYYEGWYQVTSYQLTVDTDKIKKDAGETQEILQRLVEKVKDRATGGVDEARGGARPAEDVVETESGWVKQVDAANKCFLMTTVGNDEVTMYISPTCAIRLDGEEIQLRQLQVEDQVRVTYESAGKKNMATAVKATRR